MILVIPPTAIAPPFDEVITVKITTTTSLSKVMKEVEISKNVRGYLLKSTEFN